MNDAVSITGEPGQFVFVTDHEVQPETGSTKRTVRLGAKTVPLSSVPLFLDVIPPPKPADRGQNV